MSTQRKILLLSGTREARELAASLAENPRYAVTASLAGATTAPAEQRVKTRTGGFGGVPGLAAFITENNIDAVIDATHPFARQMSGNAVEACARTGVPLLRLERPAWQPGPGAEWIDVGTLDEAAAVLPTGARAFLAIGSQGLESFAGRDDVWFLVRTWEATSEPPQLADCTVIHGSPAETGDEERDLMRSHAISHLVCKNSGGPADAKLKAASGLGIPVVMVRRPSTAGAETVSDVPSALIWLEAPG